MAKMKVGVVGFGRSGTTLVSNMIKNFFSQKNKKTDVYSQHWFSKKKHYNHEKNILILCRRDLRDVLASGFRDINKQDDSKFIINKMKNPFPKNFKVYKKKYGVPKEQLISFGEKHINLGWYQWLPIVNYIFHYEAYMRDKQKIAKELANLVGCYDVDINKAIESTEKWKRNNPKHITDARGMTNAWHDIFSKAQEKIIIDNFGDWMREYGYIK